MTPQRADWDILKLSGPPPNGMSAYLYLQQLKSGAKEAPLPISSRPSRAASQTTSPKRTSTKRLNQDIGTVAKKKRATKATVLIDDDVDDEEVTYQPPKKQKVIALSISNIHFSSICPLIVSETF